MASTLVETSCDVHFPTGPRASRFETPGPPGEPAVLYIRGDVDASVADELRRCLQVLVRGSTPTVDVDLAGVSFISCAGLAPLVEARQCLGRRLHLRAASPAATRLLRLVELDTFFDVPVPRRSAGG